MGNKNANAAPAPAVLVAGAHKAGKSCLACALCRGGDTGSFPGNAPRGAYYATNGALECEVGGESGRRLRLVENGGGSAAGRARMDAASFTDAWGAVCLCFVVDAVERDAGKIQAARAMLAALASSQPGKPIVVAAAKSDADGAMPSAEVSAAYALGEFGEGGRLFKVVAVSTIPEAPQGLDELLLFFRAAAAAMA